MNTIATQGGAIMFAGGPNVGRAELSQKLPCCSGDTSPIHEAQGINVPVPHLNCLPLEHAPWNCHVRSWKQEEFSSSILLFRRKAKGGMLSNMAFFSWRHQGYLKRIDPSRPRV